MPAYTFQEREAIKQAQMQAQLQWKAQLEARQANAATTRPLSDPQVSPFATAQTGPSARMANSPGGPGSSPSETIKAQHEPVQHQDKTDAAPSLLPLLIILLMLCILVYALLRGNRI